MQKLVSLMGVLISTVVLAADTWHVDSSAVGGDETGTGSPTSPFQTIGHAVTRASAGDTIVLAPGDYAETEGSSQVEVSGQTVVSRVRVIVDKPLVFRAKDVSSKPRVVGRLDTSDSGMGAEAIRGMWFTAEASGSELHGLEFVDCASGFDAGGGAAGGLTSGGGVYIDGAITVVDCAFLNCRAIRGAAINASTLVAVRSLFKGGCASKFGSAFRATRASAYNCVFDDNTSLSGAGVYVASGGTSADVFNCTFVNNGDYVASGTLCNCLIADGISKQTTAICGKMTNCVVNVPATTYQIPAEQMCVQYTRVVPSCCEVFSPLTGDYRLMPAAASLTAADADFLQNIPAEYRDTDFYGNPRLTGGVVYCGAVQGVAVRFGGGLSLTAAESTKCPLAIDGKPAAVYAANYSWAAKDTLPAVFELTASPAGSAQLVAFSLGNAGDFMDWPRRDGVSAAVMPPVGTMKALSSIVADNILYVDPVKGSDSAAGDKDHPWLSVQKALDAIDDDTVIHVASGTIAPDPAELSAKGRARLLVTNVTAKVRVVADEGPSATSIVGAADPSPANANDYGLGPQAVRCILMDGVTGVVGFQGFTLKDGRMAHVDDGLAVGWTQGGAMYGCGRKNSQMIDCVISDCNASRGAAVTGVSLVRCRISDCTVVKQAGIVRDGMAVSTSVTGCRTVDYAATKASAFYNSTAYNCTVSDAMGMPVMQNDADVVAWNCVFSASKENFYANQLGSISNVLCSVISPWMGANDTVVEENPVRFRVGGTDAGALRFDSRGVSLAKAENAVSPMDLNGSVFAFAADGSFAAGALNPAPPRTNYVDAVNGIDAEGRGGTSAKAFKTLAYAMDGCEAGDVLVALPGVYANGTMLETADMVKGGTTPTVSARVVVKPGVKLVSAQGAGVTVIEGEADTSSSSELVDGHGNGPKAVRCAFLGEGASIEGFTLRKGHTNVGPASGAGVNDLGGGVWGYDKPSSLVCDCVISNCTAGRSGAGAYATFRRCVISDCASDLVKAGIYFREACLEGCYVSTLTPQAQACCTRSSAYQTTFSGFANRSLLDSGDYDLFNCVSDGTKIDLVNVSNCVFNAGTVTNEDDAARLGPIVVGDVRLDANGRPLTGSASIDAGSNGLLLPVLADGDLGGNQRIMNRTVDAGCWEYDCRGDYARVLKRRGVTVTSVSPDAQAVNGGVELTSGMLSLVWEHSQTGQSCSFAVAVTGTGTLTVSLNGQVLGTYTVQDGSRTVPFKSAGISDDLTFTYVPGANDTGVARISSLRDVIGLILMVR